MTVVNAALYDAAGKPQPELPISYPALAMFKEIKSSNHVALARL